MRRITILIVLLTCLFGCKPTGIDNPEKRNENWCWFVDKTTGEGKWVPVTDETTLSDGDYTMFFCNGAIRQTGKLKDRKDSDTIFVYDLSGKLISKVLNLPDSTFKKFMLDGKYKSYFSTCELSGEGEFKNNMQIGTRIEYYKNGKIELKSIANADSLVVMRFFETGNPFDSYLTVNDTLEGVAKIWYDNGNLKKQIKYKKGLRDSLCFWFYENGQIETKSYYKNDLKDSLCIWYYENGQVDTKCYFKNDKVNGNLIAYYESSKIKCKGYFKDGKEEGLAINYFESGQLSSKINWTNGEKNGDIWLYHPNGKLKMYAKSNMGVTTYYKSYDANGKVEEEFKDGNKIYYRNK